MKFKLNTPVVFTEHARAANLKDQKGVIVGRSEYVADQAAPDTHELPADPGKDGYLVRFRPEGSDHDHTRWAFEHEIKVAPAEKA